MYYFILVLFLSASPIFAGLTLEFYRGMPGRWLCEWDESPQDMHMPGCRCGNGRRVRLFLTLIFIISLIASIFALTYNVPSGKEKIDYVLLSAELLYLCGILFLLGIASMSDMKYMIIPDQVSIALAVMAAFRCAVSSFFYISAEKESFYIINMLSETNRTFTHILSPEVIISLISEMLAVFKPMAVGALAAGGSAVFAVFISAAIYRRETMGFGDVKLMAVCGGLAGSFAVFSPFKFQGYMFCGLISSACAGFMVYAGAIILSAVYFACWILCRKIKIGEEIPLAPWISVSAVCTILVCIIF